MDHFKEVKRWHRERGLPCGEASFEDIKFRKRRARLIAEEFVETIEALGFECGLDIYEEQGPAVFIHDTPLEGRFLSSPELFLDGLADLGVICEGSAVELGWDYNEARRRVQASNDTKPKTRDGNGKVIKGPSFIPPDLKDLTK